MAARKATKSTNRRSVNGTPAGFVEVQTTLAGFWKPTIVGQSVQGIVGDAVDVQGPDGKTNTFYSLTVTDDHGGPIVGKDNKPVKIAAGQMIGVGGKMLLIFLRGREGKEVYLMYDGLGKAKPGQSAPKMFRTFAHREDD